MGLFIKAVGEIFEGGEGNQLTGIFMGQTMAKNYPQKKETIYSRRMGEEWMLYDSNNEGIHVINATAEYVWRLCDGSNSREDIKEKISIEYNVPDGADLSMDIDAILEKFQELGVLMAQKQDL